MFSTAVADPREEHRGPVLSSVFFLKDKIPHTMDKLAWNVNLMIYLMDMWPLPIGQYCQSSVIFCSEKDQIDKYR